MMPIVLALGVVAPAAYAVSELANYKRHTPYSRRQRRAVVWRIRIAAWTTIAAMVTTILWLR